MGGGALKETLFYFSFFCVCVCGVATFLMWWIGATTSGSLSGSKSTSNTTAQKLMQDRRVLDITRQAKWSTSEEKGKDEE